MFSDRLTVVMYLLNKYITKMPDIVYKFIAKMTNGKLRIPKEFLTVFEY